MILLRKSFFHLGLHQVNILDNINLYPLGENTLFLRLNFFRTLLKISRLIKRKTICCTLLLTSTVHLTINYPNHYIFLFFHSHFYVPYTNSKSDVSFFMIKCSLTYGILGLNKNICKEDYILNIRYPPRHPRTAMDTRKIQEIWKMILISRTISR